MAERPAPFQLYQQALEETKGQPNAKLTERYLELMREHGHLVPRQPGDDSPLFACGYDPRPGRRRDPQAGQLPDHILDADVLTLDSGTWFAHSHEHRDHPDAQPHTHRHDHRRRSKRGDYDHHVPVDQPARAGSDG